MNVPSWRLEVVKATLGLVKSKLDVVVVVVVVVFCVFGASEGPR